MDKTNHETIIPGKAEREADVSIPATQSELFMVAINVNPRIEF